VLDVFPEVFLEGDDAGAYTFEMLPVGETTNQTEFEPAQVFILEP